MMNSPRSSPTTRAKYSPSERRKAEIEVGARIECRRSLLRWCEFALAKRGVRPAKHHRLIISKLEAAAERRIRRLMIFAPPGSAKSTFVSQLFPAWLFARYPRCQIIGASHTAELAEDFSTRIHRWVRENEKRLGYGLATENRSNWTTTTGGVYVASGVGGALPGRRADAGIIDDPVKGRQAADSEADRKRVWEWYLGDFERRLTPGAPVVIILTRWHEDDLAGRLLSSQPRRWDVLSLPAEAEENDPLCRAPGEWLWGDDEYGYAASLPDIKRDLENAGATREWAAQYQQKPRPDEGAIFKVGEIAVLPVAPTDCRSIVRAWDLAATKDIGARDADWTVGVKMGLLKDGRYVVLSVHRFRGTPDEVERAILNVAAQDGPSVRIGLPQDPGQAGKYQAQHFTKLLAGYAVESSPESGDKAERAAPAASQCNVGNLAVVEGPYMRPFLDELAAFPSGAHDDQVDALSRAFMMLTDPRGGALWTPENFL
jgi:predicted phage terminase large subunit-like protein